MSAFNTKKVGVISFFIINPTKACKIRNLRVPLL